MLNQDVNFINKSILISVRSNKIDTLLNAYYFTEAALNHKNLIIKMIFFYQNAAYILLNSELSYKWKNLINKNNLNAKICKGSIKKRGILIQEPFQESSLIEFINLCEQTERIIQF